mgnify:CR=1 FL=1
MSDSSSSGKSARDTSKSATTGVSSPDEWQATRAEPASREEIDEWRRRDPIRRLEQELWRDFWKLADDTELVSLIREDFLGAVQGTDASMAAARVPLPLG